MRHLELYEAIGWRLAEVRANRHLTLTQAAELAGITRQQLQKFEYGGCPPVWVLVKLAEAYDCTLDDFVPVDVRAAE